MTTWFFIRYLGFENDPLRYKVIKPVSKEYKRRLDYKNKMSSFFLFFLIFFPLSTVVSNLTAMSVLNS